MNRYKYCLLDASYLIQRNGWAIDRGREGEAGWQALVRSVFQTINKVGRDFGVTADKYILGFDSWSDEYSGYYRTKVLREAGVNYKGSREIPTQAGLEELKSLGVSPGEIEKYERALRKNGEMRKAKSVIRNEFIRIGIPTIGVKGFEFDDLAYLLGTLGPTLTENWGHSVVVSGDSDLLYCTAPDLDYFKLPVGKNTPEIHTYQDSWGNLVKDSLKEGLVQAVQGTGQSPLYYYKALSDALGDGHNDMKTSKARRRVTDTVISEILKGDYSGVLDRGVFDAQLRSFNVLEFPDTIQAVQVLSTIGYCGHYPGPSDFAGFCQDHGIHGITYEYFMGFRERLDQKLFAL